MIRKILEAVVGVVVFGPFAILLFLALAGAVAALVGGLAGWETLRTSGGAAAGFGALGFFAWLFIAGYFQLFDLLNLYASTAPNSPAPSNVSQSNSAQTKVGSLGNNGRSI
jgi:hypothetical protein